MKTARKVATNVSAQGDIVREAKALGLNLSEFFEAAVVEAIRRKRQDAWLDENHDAIESYNTLVARGGVFSDGWRKF
jgi:antitoxin CcdA